MWRWVTRGLVLSLVSLCTAAALADEPTDFIGKLELPDPAVTQSGEILLRGWAYDIQQVSHVDLYVDDQYQFKVPMGLARVDVVETNPTFPGIQNSAPGFEAGFLARNYTNGPHTVEVRVYLSDGRMIPLGRRTITIDNTINQSPFGSVDVPDLGAVYNASGSFPVSGWAADTDGIARIDIYVDNGVLQSAMYGDPRPDVGNAFPDFPDAVFSGFVANIDTTRIKDGVHLMSVRATDTLGLSREIGRRQIQIFNDQADLKPFGYLDEPKPNTVLYGTLCDQVPTVVSPFINPTAHITPVRGWALDLSTRTDIGRVGYVELVIDGVPWYSTDDCAYNAAFGMNVNCYHMPRYDVARYYPTYPDAPLSGYMFTLDVGALLAVGVPAGGHTMKVRVGDLQGTFAELPTRDGIPVIFNCADSNHDFASLGFIDVPRPFAYVGGLVTFSGWAIDENGGVSSVGIFVDGDYLGQASYGYQRADVQVGYPQIANSLYSGWRFQMDTSHLSNARHRLVVRVTDNAGHQSEIGSSDFYVANP